MEIQMIEVELSCTDEDEQKSHGGNGAQPKAYSIFDDESKKHQS